MPATIASRPTAAAVTAETQSSATATADGSAGGTLPAELNASFGAMVNQSGKSGPAKGAVAPIGDAEVLAHINALNTPDRRSNIVETKATIQQQIDDPKTPPDLKVGLQNFLSVFDGNNPTFSDQEMGVISALQRHRGEFPIKVHELQKRIDDPKTPPDLKAALMQVKDDPTLRIALDAKNQGGGVEHADGCLSDRDLDRLGELPAMKAFNEAQAKVFVSNYIPSDAPPSMHDAREMTENDAAREFYLYSDNLPGRMNTGTLQKIVEGEAGCKKCPPQVIAAAQYFRDHPAAWEKVTGGDSNKFLGCSRSDLLDNISKSVYLDPDETATLDTLDKNKDIFFSSVMTRDSLKAIVDNPDSKPDVKNAAQKLIDDPLLFGMLDNGKKGHSSNLIKTADDGKISKDDLSAFMEHLTTKGKKPPPLPPTHKATTADEKGALAAMQAGQVDDPEIKKEKGGGLIHFLRSVITPFLKIGEMLEHAISLAMSVLTKIPIIGEIAGAISIAAEAIAGGFHMATAAINGADLKKAAIAVGAGIAGALVGLVVTGAGPAIARGITAGVEHVAMAASSKAGALVGGRGAAKAATSAGTEGATATAERGAAKAATSAGDESATTTAGSVAKTEGGDQAKREAKQKARSERKDELKDEVTDNAVNTSVDNSNSSISNGSGQVPLMGMQGASYDSIIADAGAEASRLKAHAAAAQNGKSLTAKSDAAKAQAVADNGHLHGEPNPDSVAAATA